MPEYDSTISYRPVKDFPGYCVGSDGTVWSSKSGKWKQRTLGKTKKGHRYVIFPGVNLRYVHRLVLEAFVGPCPDGMECRHNTDPNPSNNNLDNLRWGTHSENERDKAVHGTHRKGERHPISKLTADLVADIRRRHAAGERQMDLALAFGVHRITIHGIVRHPERHWPHVSTS